jgi:hypothetical protein
MDRAFRQPVNINAHCSGQEIGGANLIPLLPIVSSSRRTVVFGGRKGIFQILGQYPTDIDGG